MRIAQVAPLYEAVPPRLYGGTERIVSYLTEGLVRRGHDVTLFASGDSVTSAHLQPQRKVALRLDPSLSSAAAAHISMLHEVRKRQRDFDIIHVHLSHFVHFPVFESMPSKVVTTPHGRLDYVDLADTYARWPTFPMISISMRQRQPLPDANWVGNVYHGLPLDLYAPLPRQAGNKPYLAFLGRISPEKRVDRAIEIARRSKMPLRIAAKIEGVDQRYFDEKIAHLIDGADVEFIGEVNDAEKVEFLSNAHALLFPIDWPEPFGMVMIEAMACGIPVIAWRCGAVPEILDDGVTGFIVDSQETAEAAVVRAGALDRRRIRQVFEEKFDADRMVADYEVIFERLLKGTEAIDLRSEGRPGVSGPILHAEGLNGGRSQATR